MSIHIEICSHVWPDTRKERRAVVGVPNTPTPRLTTRVVYPLPIKKIKNKAIESECLDNLHNQGGSGSTTLKLL
jgi:hypothetical protein